MSINTGEKKQEFIELQKVNDQAKKEVGNLF